MCKYSSVFIHDPSCMCVCVCVLQPLFKMDSFDVFSLTHPIFHIFRDFCKCIKKDVVTIVVRVDMTGPRCSMVRVHFFLFINVANKTKNKHSTVSLTSAKQATNKDNYPQLRWHNRLPKYDSQSETTIDSCL